MNNQTPTANRFQAINWSNYSQRSNKGLIEPDLVSAMMDCFHTHEFGAEAQSWKEYSQIIEINPAGEVVKSTYYVTL